MSSKYKLTIGVPTYNRVGAATHNLEKIIANGLSHRDDIEILFIDNHSTDDTVASLKRTAGAGKNIRVLSNSRNLGFSGNFLRIIEESRGQYVLVTSDEDLVDSNVLDDLLEILRPQTYTAVTSYFSRGGTSDYPRGNPVRTEIVDPSQYRFVANYISGVCFRTSASRNALPILDRYQAGPAGVYIQNLLVAVLMLDGPVLSWKTQVCHPHAELPTLVPPYGYLQHRWDQTKEYLAFLDELDATRSESRQIIASLRRGTIDDVVGSFSQALSLEGVNYQKAFEASVVNHALRHVSTKTLAREVLSRVRKKIRSFFLR
ncbi:MAG: glycosyltransferase family 2 protein [Planctomycetota bacterium]|nr:glycosyltransferase family 2 protein [Planctomycetota bacterium]